MALQLKKFYQINVKAWYYSLYGKESYDAYKKEFNQQWQNEINEPLIENNSHPEEEIDFSFKDGKARGTQINGWIDQGVSRLKIRCLLIETLEKENFAAMDEIFDKNPEMIFPFYTLMWLKDATGKVKDEISFSPTDLGKIYMCERMKAERPGFFSYKEVLQNVLNKNGSEEMIVYCISSAVHENKEVDAIEYFLNFSQLKSTAKNQFAKKYLLNLILEKSLPVNEEDDDARPVAKI